MSNLAEHTPAILLRHGQHCFSAVIACLTWSKFNSDTSCTYFDDPWLRNFLPTIDLHSTEWGSPIKFNLRIVVLAATHELTVQSLWECFQSGIRQFTSFPRKTTTQSIPTRGKPSQSVEIRIGCNIRNYIKSVASLS